MTENEKFTIDELIDFMYNVMDDSDEEAIPYVKEVIQALEEIQQYRAIGTVEEIQSMKENGAFYGIELAQIASMQMKLKEYQSIGTIEEFKALKEKRTAKSRKIVAGKYFCPDCGITADRGYCKACGQNLY